jgi:uncharacterized protein YjbI with pentapeptide repeats
MGQQGAGTQMAKTLNRINVQQLIANARISGEGVDLVDANLVDANLSGIDLTGANMIRANLGRANLVNANLVDAKLFDAKMINVNLIRANMAGADMFEANLASANLAGANLAGANLAGAHSVNVDLTGATLIDANLTESNLAGTNLKGADLTGANFFEAYMPETNLTGAKLSRASLVGAKLAGANLTDVSADCATVGYWPVCPEGDVIGWKRCRDHVVQLRVPADARRSSATTRKCRAEHVEVLAVFRPSENEECEEVAESKYDFKTTYTKGKIVQASYWDIDRWRECSGGIHFFLTREEAELWI